MSRYTKALLTLAAALAIQITAPLPAGAGCPGCEEYTLDIPKDDGTDAPATPAPAPPAAAPQTTPVPTTPEVAPTEASTDVVVPDPRKPVDRDPDPAPAGAAAQPARDEVPAVTASQVERVSDTGADGAASLWPLAIAMVVVAAAGVFLRARGSRESSR